MSQYPQGYSAYYAYNQSSAQPPPLPPPPRQQSTPQTSQYNQYQQSAAEPLRRTPSYVPGDDSTPIETRRYFAADGTSYPAHGHAATGAVYDHRTSTTDSSLGSHRSQLSTAGSQRSNPSRSSSRGSSNYSSYQHSYSPQASTSTQPGQPAYNPQAYNNAQSYNPQTYNPQQYSRPHSYSLPGTSYNPQAFSSLNTSSQYSPPPQHYQAYNPAAYQSSNATNYAINTQRPAISVPPRYAQYSTPASSSDHAYGARPSHEPSPNPPYPYSPTSPVTQHSTTGYMSGPTSPTYTSAPSFPGASPQLYSPYRASQSSLYSSVDTLVTQEMPTATMPDLPPAPPVHQSFGDQPYGRPSSGSDPAVAASMSSSAYPAGAGSSPRRSNTLDRHPQARPLPGPPPDAEESDVPTGNGGIYDLMNEVEAAMEERPLTAAESSGSRLSQSNPHTPDVARPDPLLAEGNQAIHLSPDERHTHTNGNVPTGTGQYINYDAYSDDSDAEAEAGLAMMREAEEEERAEAERLQSSGGPRSSLFAPYGALSAVPSSSTPPKEDSDSESDVPRYDIALYEGGYQGNLHYGEEELKAVAEARSRRTSDVERPENPEDPGHLSDDGQFYLPSEESIHPFPYPSSANARVDTGGTGGLSEPGPVNNRRMSFDDGDEEGALAGHDSAAHSESESPIAGEPPDLFFHPGMRPLPPPPVAPAAGTSPTRRSEDQDASGQSRPLPQPTPSDSYGFTVPRSTSLSDHSNTPRTDPPIRSKTDADRARHRQQSQQQLPHRPASMFAYNAPLEPSALALDLPTLPAARRKKFNPAKLSSEQFRKCSEPWALSAIVAWIKDLAEEETDLKEQAVVEAIVALFTHKVPTMNIADAETLADRVVKNMLEEGALVKEEEWVKFGQGTLSGVLFQITGSGCYSSRVHEQETENFDRCYSHHCMRTLKKINLKAEMMEPQKKAEDWVTFYKVPREVWEAHPRKEIDRQNNLHEIVTTEDAYIAQLDLLRELYRDQLATIQPPVINPKRLEKFLTDVFGKVDAVKKVNEDYLLAQMKYRQKEQGPFIVGFSDIFREWIRRAKTTYIEYAATFPHANYLVRMEAERNPMFQQFLDQARDNPKSNRLSWDTYLKAPITRIQRYTLLLSTVHKNMVKESEEKTNLAQAIEEIKMVAMECDNKVGEMTKKVDLMELSSKLQLRPEMKKVVELNLEHLGRQVIFRGDLQRPGTRTRFNLVDTHAILFDHYLVLAKAVQSRDPRSGKQEIYDVSKLPIPMDLLVLESTNDDPVVKSAVRGISTVTPAAAVAARGSGTGTNPSANATFASSDGTRDDKILFPFKVKHLGKTGTYTLYSTSLQNRQEWCEKIIEAKSKHAASLFAQNAEPFRLRVLADVSFAYSESPGPKPVTIKGTPLDRAIQEVEARYANLPKPNVVCRAAVNCATVFQQRSGQLMCAIGTDAGVFISPYDDPRGWVRAIPARNVTQITVFEDFNLLLLIADRSLIAYHLDVVCPANGVPAQTSQHDSSRRAPQKLSGNREVGFFAVGRMKDRILVFYKKRDGISSTFKVLEPVLQKSVTNRSRFLSRRGQTDFFRDYDEFYIPTESYNINLFHSSLAIATQRGIEVMTLDKKQPWSVPFLRSETPEAQSYLTSIGNRIKDLRPLGMFRLSDSEFIIAYSECAVYVNKHGDVSRSVIMEFVGQAQTACLYGRFLILFNEDFVEVRNAMNGRLRQVIPGRNVVCLDHGGNPIGNGLSPMNGSNFSPAAVNGHFSSTSDAGRGRTVKFCMQHPKYERSQLVVELIENEGQKD